MADDPQNLITWDTAGFVCGRFRAEYEYEIDDLIEVLTTFKKFLKRSKEPLPKHLSVVPFDHARAGKE